MKTYFFIFLSILHVTSAFNHPSPSNPFIKGVSQSQINKSFVLHASTEYTNEDTAIKEDSIQRRSFLQSSILKTGMLSISSLLLNNNLAMAAEGANNDISLETYEDSDCGFQLQVPNGWEKSIQALPDRRKIVFFVDPKTKDSEKDKSLIFVAYTPVRDDFTSISSFGSVDQVAQMTILPKSKIAMIDDNESKMLSSDSKKNAYYFDYTIKAENQPKRHFRTIFALANGATGGAGSVLVTITAQSTEEKYNEYKNAFDKLIDSYGKI